ncbi:hypothetical protein ILFOPFJJ_06738 [Ensifer psoraleae]|nr:hypothetical protein [Sinorhizobium psoraleae]
MPRQSVLQRPAIGDEGVEVHRLVGWPLPLHQPLNQRPRAIDDEDAAIVIVQPGAPCPPLLSGWRSTRYDVGSDDRSDDDALCKLPACFVQRLPVTKLSPPGSLLWGI